MFQQFPKVGDRPNSKPDKQKSKATGKLPIKEQNVGYNKVGYIFEGSMLLSVTNKISFSHHGPLYWSSLILSWRELNQLSCVIFYY